MAQVIEHLTIVHGLVSGATVGYIPIFLSDGEQGEEGMPIPGVAGAAGIAGTAGVPGQPGLDGDEGPEGMPMPGSPGQQGPVGLQGPPVLMLDGDQGEEGMPVPGNIGATGATGLQGAPIFMLDGDPGQDAEPMPGSPGQQGPVGLQGVSAPLLDPDEGPEGMPVPGSPGQQGGVGLQGVPVFMLDGDEGQEGMPVPGNVGATGATGLQGVSAPLLDPDEGPEGMPIPGPPGQQGATGLQGVPVLMLDGDQGEEGMPIPGNVGATGATGLQGSPVFMLDGDPGADGEPMPGSPGAQGPAGLQGVPIFMLDGEQGEEGMPVYAQATDSNLLVSDLTANNVTSTKHGFAPKSPSDATQFLNGAATPAWAVPTWPPNYIDRLKLTWTDATHMVVQAGDAIDSTNTVNMSLASDTTLAYDGSTGLNSGDFLAVVGTGATNGTTTLVGTGTVFTTAFVPRSLTGTVTNTGTACVGVGTKFLSQVAVNDLIGTAAAGYQRVTAIADDTHLTLAVTFAASALAVNCIEQPIIVVGSTAPPLRRVVAIADDTHLTMGALISSTASGLTLGISASGFSDGVNPSYQTVWLVVQSGTVGVLLSPQRTKPYLANVTAYRLLTAVVLDKSGNLIQFSPQPPYGPLALAPGYILAQNYVATDESTTSATFVDLTTLDTVTFFLPAPLNVLANYQCTTYKVTGATTGYIQFMLDGTLTGTVFPFSEPTANYEFSQMGNLASTYLGVGLHTIKVQHRVDSAAGHWLGRQLTVNVSP